MWGMKFRSVACYIFLLQTKFVKARRDLLEFPNPFPYGPPKKIAVFCFVSTYVVVA